MSSRFSPNLLLVIAIHEKFSKPLSLCSAKWIVQYQPITFLQNWNNLDWKLDLLMEFVLRNLYFCSTVAHTHRVYVWASPPPLHRTNSRGWQSFRSQQLTSVLPVIRPIKGLAFLLLTRSSPAVYLFFANKSFGLSIAFCSIHAILLSFSSHSHNYSFICV